MHSRKIPRPARKRDPISVLLERILKIVPHTLRVLPVWLLWKSVDGRKVPFYHDGTRRRGTLDTEDERARLVTFEEVARVLKRLRRFSGVGIALGPVPGCDVHISGIDLDHVIESDDIDPRALELLAHSDCYAELSPSGKGMHILGIGNVEHTDARVGTVGLEIYSGARYFTVTGRTLNHAGLIDLASTAALARRLFLEAETPSDSGLKPTRLVATNRNIYLSRKAYALRKEGADIAAIEQVLLAINSALCSPPLTKKEVRGIARKKTKITPDAAAPWPVPTPLMRELAPGIEYPVSALGPTLSAAAEAIIEIAQVPAALAANSLLAVSALAAQPFTNVETLAGPRPVSLDLLTVAYSGDRKTTADGIALAPVRLRIAALRKDYAEEMRQYKADVEAHKLREQNARDLSGDDPDQLAEALLKLREPVPPRKPLLLCSEPTPEGLFLSLRDGQYSQGLFSDEGGTFLGSHAMSEESELRTISMLSRLWDGGSLDRVRAKEAEQTTLGGRRLTFHLMMQPIVAAGLLGRPLFRQQGFLARCLIAAPASLAGSRLHNPDRPSSTEDARIRSYEAAITTLLWKPLIRDAETPDGIAMSTMKLCAAARQLLVAAYDQMERAQGPEGQLAPVREWASKAAEHACRIAAVITLVGDKSANQVSADAMQGAIALVEFYLNEYTRLVDGFSPSPEVEVAQKLLEWLQDKRPRTITVRRITQFGPSGARVAETARRTLRLLSDHGWVRTQDGRTWDVHPELWDLTTKETVA